MNTNCDEAQARTFGSGREGARRGRAGRSGGRRNGLCAIGAGVALWLFAGAALAEAPKDSVLEAMKDRAVVVVKEDGTKVRGTLAGFDAESVTVLAKDGEPVNVPRGEVKSLRGDSRANPEKQAATAPSSEEGVVVHIESNNPEVSLYRLGAEATVVAGGEVGYVQAYQKVCTAPCDRPIDGSRGEGFFLSLNGFRLGSTFQLRDPDGDGQATLGATIHRTPSRGLLWGGLTIASLGAAAGAVGAVFGAIGFGNEYKTNYETGSERLVQDNSAMWWGVAGGGGALLVGGVVMAVLSRGSYDLQLPDKQEAGLRLHHVAITPPVIAGDQKLPATASLAFTF